MTSTPASTPTGTPSATRATRAARAGRPPTAVRAATVLWAVAIMAGVVETLLVVVPGAAAGELDPGTTANLALRGGVYALAAGLVVAFFRGRAGARVALAVLLSGLGLASMVGPAGAAIAGGAGFLDAVGSGSDPTTAFVVVRLLHVTAVLTATVTMFLPAANGWFARASSRPVG